MFKKNKVQVIKVKHETRDIETRESWSGGYISLSSHSKTVTHKKVKYTIVLFIKNGELYSKEFNGEWNMDDVKHMNK